jgi:magnesium chelatase subunit D
MTAADGARAWHDAALAAVVFALDPAGIGGVSLRAPPGLARDRWLALLRDALADGAAMRRVPLNVTDGRLLGGLDLAATLRANRPIAERGILAEADGGVVLLAMAERLTGATAARLAAVLDTGEVVAARDGLALRSPARVGVVALDEGIAADEHPPAALLDRLALHLDLSGLVAADADIPARPAIAAARARIAEVTADDTILDALCTTAAALGIASLRAPLLALRVARGAAALAGRDVVTQEDAAQAARLVLAPRATLLPVPEPPQDAAAPEDQAHDTAPPHPPPDGGDEAAESDDTPAGTPLGDILLAAAQAAIPAGVLAQLAQPRGGRARTAGRAGAPRSGGTRGRAVGVRAGDPRDGQRLNVIETLRAAAPWQRLRGGSQGKIQVRRDDFRVSRIKQRSETTTIFVVDASGSAALNRLAEAKGAVELLLAESYVRRDRVAVMAFRGRGAELLLPPTRSLVRAKRSLAGLPGGGGTPLAAGIDAAFTLADGVRRHGETPTIILLTDGRANVARDGGGGRARAEQEAVSAARMIRAARLAAVVVDTSPRPHDFARRIASEMAARYLPLPYAGAAALSRAVRAATRPAA